MCCLPALLAHVKRRASRGQETRKTASQVVGSFSANDYLLYFNYYNTRCFYHTCTLTILPNSVIVIKILGQDARGLCHQITPKQKDRCKKYDLICTKRNDMNRTHQQ